MEEIVRQLRSLLPFKAETVPGDIVLVAFHKENQALYAVVQDIQRDTSKRDPWWHLTLLFLTVPPQRAVWTLREPQFTGEETFGMGEEELFMQAVDLGQPPAPPPPKRGQSPATVLNLADFRKTPR
ncbi:MAG: hypothetical protein AB1634_15450 [Thermodesulfobacteriota bacterium]